MGVGGNERWRGAAGDGRLNCKGACRPTSDLSGYFKRSSRPVRPDFVATAAAPVFVRQRPLSDPALHAADL